MARVWSTELPCLPTVPSSSAVVGGCGEGWLKVHMSGVAMAVERPSGRQVSFQSIDIFCSIYIQSPSPSVLNIFVL